MKTVLAGAVAAWMSVAVALANMPPPPPASTGSTAEAFVQGLYTAKIDAEKVSPAFGSAQTDALVLNDFAPDLLALYKQAIDIDEPIVDGDVFWDSQEYEVKKVEVKTVTSDATSAMVEASFEVTPGQARKVTFTLKRAGEGNDWQIYDILGSGGSMRSWLAEAIKGSGR